MLHNYPDILNRIPEPPLWFDSNGVPRYDPFHPSLCPNIYAEEVVLYEIACQACGKRFLVEEHSSPMDFLKTNQPPGMRTTLADGVRQKGLHYGDPPCWECASGATMNCLDIKTVEFWTRNVASFPNEGWDWHRVPELENLPLDDYQDDLPTVA